MPTMKKYILPFILLLGLLLTACGAQSSGGEEAPWQTALRQTGEYLLAQDAPSAGPVNGDWKVVGLRAAGLLERETAAVYYESVVQCAAQAVENRLNPNKPTENTRTILGVTAAGHNAADVAGVDLTAGLGDMAYLRHQGLNASVWALIALDCGAYPDPAPVEGAEPVNRETLVAELLSARCTDGGWTMMGDKAEVDITALALTALAPYTGEAAVQAAVDEALALLSDAQLPDGGFDCYGTENCESAAQVLVALTSLGIDPLTDSRFVKDGATVPDAVASFAVEGGGFRHIAEQTTPDGMATEQGFYALAAYERFTKGESRLFDMTAAEQNAGQTDAPAQQARPQPVEPEDAQVADTADCTCTVSITCEVLLDNMDKLAQNKRPLVPEDGVLLPETQVTFAAGESAFDVLQRVCRENKIHMESSFTPLYNSAYIEGIGNLYEFDAGSLSGWMYTVNDWFPNYGCSRYQLRSGDVLRWVYTCDLGKDVGGGMTN